MTLSLVVRHGCRVPEMSAELRRRLTRGLKEQLGIDVRTVNIHIRSLKGSQSVSAVPAQGSIEAEIRRLELDGDRPRF